MRQPSRTAGLVLLFVVLVALHYSARPVLAWRAGADFLLIGVLLIAVRMRPGTAALVGLAAGVASDALSPAAFGAGAMAMTLVATMASWLKAEFFAEHLGLTAVFLLGGKLAFDAIFLLMEQRIGVGEIAMQLITWSLLSAMVTAIAGLTVLVIFRPFTDIVGRRA